MILSAAKNWVLGIIVAGLVIGLSSLIYKANQSKLLAYKLEQSELKLAACHDEFNKMEESIEINNRINSLQFSDVIDGMQSGGYFRD